MCDNEKMDFSKQDERMKQMVFWYTVVLLSLNFVFFMTITYYTCCRMRRILKANLLTKVQLILLFALVIFQII